MERSDHDLLIQISERVEMLIRREQEHQQLHQLRCEQVERRLTVLEKWRWQLVGAATLAFLLGSLISHTVSWLYLR